MTHLFFTEILRQDELIEAGPAKIQVLNQAYAANDFVNNSSVAYLVSLNGTNVVFLGDMARSGGENLMANVDLGALNCTMVQMAHHGQNRVDYEVYKGAPSIRMPVAHTSVALG